MYTHTLHILAKFEEDVFKIVIDISFGNMTLRVYRRTSSIIYDVNVKQVNILSHSVRS